MREILWQNPCAFFRNRKWDALNTTSILVVNLAFVWTGIGIFLTPAKDPLEEFAQYVLDIIQGNIVWGILIHFIRKVCFLVVVYHIFEYY